MLALGGITHARARGIAPLPQVTRGHRDGVLWDVQLRDNVQAHGKRPPQMHFIKAGVYFDLQPGEDTARNANWLGCGLCQRWNSVTSSTYTLLKRARFECAQVGAECGGPDDTDDTAPRALAPGATLGN